MSPRSQQADLIHLVSPNAEEGVVAMEEALKHAQTELSRLREDFARLKERTDDQARKLIAAELAQRAAEEEIERVREQAEARRRVDLGAVEKRVAEEVLRAEANEVAKRRKAEQEVARLRADLLAAEQATQSHRRKSEEALQKLLDQERSLRLEAHAEVEKYKAAAKEAWQSAEEEVERLAAEAEKARAELREEQVRRKRIEQEVTKLRKQLAEGAPSAGDDLGELARQTAQQELSSLREKSGTARAKLADEEPRVDDSKVSLDDIRRLQAVYRSYVTPPDVAGASLPDSVADVPRAAMDIPLFDASSVGASAPEAAPVPKGQTVANPLEAKGLGSRFAAVEASISKRDELIPGRIQLDLDEPSLEGGLSNAQDEFEDDFVVFYPTDEDLIAASHAHVNAPSRAATAHATAAFHSDISEALAAKSQLQEGILAGGGARERDIYMAAHGTARPTRRRTWVTLLMGVMLAGGAAAFYLTQSPTQPSQVGPSAPQPTAAVKPPVAPAPAKPASAANSGARKSTNSGAVKREKP
jgi:hypothetical protein